MASVTWLVLALVEQDVRSLEYSRRLIEVAEKDSGCSNAVCAMIRHVSWASSRRVSSSCRVLAVASFGVKWPKSQSVGDKITPGLDHLSSHASRYVKWKVHASRSSFVRSLKSCQFVVVVTPSWCNQPGPAPPPHHPRRSHPPPPKGPLQPPPRPKKTLCRPGPPPGCMHRKLCRSWRSW